MTHTKSAFLFGFLLPALVTAGNLPASIAAPSSRGEHELRVQTVRPVVIACLKYGATITGRVLEQGQQTASGIYEGIGVELRWSCHPADIEEPATDNIIIRLADSAPKNFPAGALAYALPFASKGVRITLFYDRIESILLNHSAYAGVILGHILAHETGHVLAGVDSHSKKGLMRARWNEKDFDSMRIRAFGFDPQAAQFIRNRLAQGYGNGAPGGAASAAVPEKNCTASCE